MAVSHEFFDVHPDRPTLRLELLHDAVMDVRYSLPDDLQPAGQVAAWLDLVAEALKGRIEGLNA